MNRLTFVDEDGNVLFGVNGADADEGYTIFQLAEEGMADELEEIANRLANAEQRLEYYEDLEEQCRLIELPCAVGDILYGSNEEFVIKEISYWEDDCDLYSLNIKIEDWKENFEIIDPEDIGKTVFTTKEEAEAKLAEMEGEE